MMIVMKMKYCLGLLKMYVVDILFLYHQIA